MRYLFVLAVLFLPFALFLGLVLVRKARYRELAAKLGARHESGGFLSPGTIVGEDFHMEVVQFGKSYFTRVHVSAGATPGWFLLEREFFSHPTSWEHAKVRISRAERIFLWHLSLSGYSQPSPDQREALLAWSPRIADLTHLQAELEEAGIRSILVEDGNVCVDYRGVESSLERVQRTLDVLRQIVPSQRLRRAVA
jgi:hypothetical protein